MASLTVWKREGARSNPGREVFLAVIFLVALLRDRGPAHPTAAAGARSLRGAEGAL